jgi:hypothetical protein
MDWFLKAKIERSKEWGLREGGRQSERAKEKRGHGKTDERIVKLLLYTRNRKMRNTYIGRKYKTKKKDT